MTARRSRGSARGGPGHTRSATRLPLPVGQVRIATGTVEVVRDRTEPQSVTVLVNGVPSSHLNLDDPTWLEFEYMQQMAVMIRHLRPGPLDAVHLGAAACTLPRWLEAERPGSRQVAVDLDGELLTLVRTWFDLPRSPRLRLRAGEAREVLSVLPDASADVIVRDVFAADSTPRHLCTVEFVAEVARVLRPGGLYLANCADRPPLTVARAEVATARTVLGDVALSAEPAQLKGRRYGNLVLAGTPGVPGTRGAPDLGGAGLARTLRCLPVPVRLLHGRDLDEFAGGARPLHDPTTEPPDDEAAAPDGDAASGR